MITPSLLSFEHSPSLSLRQAVCLTNFEVIAPGFRTSQKELLMWLAAAHARSGKISRESMAALFSRYGASAEQIAYRQHDLPDFTHERWNDMRLFCGAPSTIDRKTEFFDQSVDSVFERLYPEGSLAPRQVIHVTCTGYSAPSGAQRLVSARGWGEATQVLHAYHMGCYAAHPALRMAIGLGGADIVHTEMCSLHLNPSNHDPAQLVIQSLFADGFIKYQAVSSRDVQVGRTEAASLEVLAARDVIVPDSTQSMRWGTGPLVFEMELSKEIPVLFASALPRFVESLFQEAGLDYSREKQAAVFAIHPGGPRIIDLSQKILGLEASQTAWSRTVLRDHGNMSSATLPHIWKLILEDSAVPEGALIISLGAGPGLTLSGALFRKRYNL